MIEDEKEHEAAQSTTATATTSNDAEPEERDPDCDTDLDEETPNHAETAAEASGEAPKVVGFEDLGLSEDALKTIRDAGYLVPTPIQEQAIPAILDGRDVIGSAQTGTGKTATFTLPIVEQIAGRGGTLAVILSPTREIAHQTFDAFETFGKPRGVRAVVLIGGVDMKPQLEALKTYPQVIVATPGRLVDHMERGTVWLDYVETVVLDEADRMLDMGFLPQINRIMNEIPENGRQTLLFSATIPPPIDKLCRTMMYDPLRISVGKPLAAASTVEQELWVCEPGRKMSQLRKILRDNKGSVIVFSRSKKGAVELWQSLHSAGFYDVQTLHSDRTQEQRLQALDDFKKGKARILIATDVAARGIDVANVSLVVNFDVPLVPEDYIHRIGRSGRAQAKGHAITLYTYQDKRLLHDIEKMMNKPIPITYDATARSRAEGHSGGAPMGQPGGEPRREGREGEGGRRSRGRRGGSGRNRDRGGEGAPAPSQSQTQTQPQSQTQTLAQSLSPTPGATGAPEGAKRRRRRRGGRGRRKGGGGGGAPSSNPGGSAPQAT